MTDTVFYVFEGLLVSKNYSLGESPVGDFGEDFAAQIPMQLTSEMMQVN